MRHRDSITVSGMVPLPNEVSLALMRCIHIVRMSLSQAECNEALKSSETGRVVR